MYFRITSLIFSMCMSVCMCSYVCIYMVYMYVFVCVCMYVCARARMCGGVTMCVVLKEQEVRGKETPSLQKFVCSHSQPPETT
jgi:hypothetical protein